MLVVVLHFSFVLHFVVFLHFIVVVLLIAFRRHPSPFRGLSPGFYTHFITFSPAHRRAIRDTFILSFPRSSLHSFTASATVLSGHFLLTDVFYFTLLHRHFTCVYQGLARGQQFFLEVCSASY